MSSRAIAVRFSSFELALKAVQERRRDTIGDMHKRTAARLQRERGRADAALGRAAILPGAVERTRGAAARLAAVRSALEKLEGLEATLGGVVERASEAAASTYEGLAARQAALVEALAQAQEEARGWAAAELGRIDRELGETRVRKSRKLNSQAQASLRDLQAMLMGGAEDD